MTNLFLKGLEGCVNLEELSLDDNCISRIEGISRLARLRMLSLGHNYIFNIDKEHLNHKNNLEYLCLENNFISSLSGLRELTGLNELYISNNRIDSVREVFYLKVSHLMSFIQITRLKIFNSWKVELSKLHLVIHLVQNINLVKSTHYNGRSHINILDFPNVHIF